MCNLSRYLPGPARLRPSVQLRPAPASPRGSRPLAPACHPASWVPWAVCLARPRRTLGALGRAHPARRGAAIPRRPPPRGPVPIGWPSASPPHGAWTLRARGSADRRPVRVARPSHPSESPVRARRGSPPRTMSRCGHETQLKGKLRGFLEENFKKTFLGPARRGSPPRPSRSSESPVRVAAPSRQSESPAALAPGSAPDQRASSSRLGARTRSRAHSLGCAGHTMAGHTMAGHTMVGHTTAGHSGRTYYGQAY